LDEVFDGGGQSLLKGSAVEARQRLWMSSTLTGVIRSFEGLATRISSQFILLLEVNMSECMF